MAVQSTMLPLGTPVPDFELPDPSGARHRLADVAAGRPVVVAFLCNHCPYVKLIAPVLGRVAVELAERGVAVVGVNSNDADAHPEDAPALMGAFAGESGWGFPYLVDEDQAVALAYGAACTPDFFLFDADGRLAYRGRFDAARPGNGVEVTGADLVAAALAVAEGRAPMEEQLPSMGCGIKWRPGNEPT